MMIYMYLDIIFKVDLKRLIFSNDGFFNNMKFFRNRGGKNFVFSCFELSISMVLNKILELDCGSGMSIRRKIIEHHT